MVIFTPSAFFDENRAYTSSARFYEQAKDSFYLEGLLLLSHQEQDLCISASIMNSYTLVGQEPIQGQGQDLSPAGTSKTHAGRAKENTGARAQWGSAFPQSIPPGSCRESAEGPTQPAARSARGSPPPVPSA